MSVKWNEKKKITIFATQPYCGKEYFLCKLWKIRLPWTTSKRISFIRVSHSPQEYSENLLNCLKHASGILKKTKTGLVNTEGKASLKQEKHFPTFCLVPVS